MLPHTKEPVQPPGMPYASKWKPKRVAETRASMHTSTPHDHQAGNIRFRMCSDAYRLQLTKGCLLRLFLTILKSSKHSSAQANHRPARKSSCTDSKHLREEIEGKSAFPRHTPVQWQGSLQSITDIQSIFAICDKSNSFSVKLLEDLESAEPAHLYTLVTFILPNIRKLINTKMGSYTLQRLILKSTYIQENILKLAG